MAVPQPRIIIAIDNPDRYAIDALVDQLDPNYCRLKIGKGVFTSHGPSLVKGLMAKGFSIFLDLKFHDIPNTVAVACKAAADMGVWLINVHASGGPAMLEAAMNALLPYKESRPLLLGVTLLTSLEQKDLDYLGVNCSIDDYVLRLANLCMENHLDGVVCSAHEAPTLRKRFGEDFRLLTPGIRLENMNNNDQRRVVTPEQAILNGVDYFVLGRTVTTSKAPGDLVKDIFNKLF